jgi:hypothetical protein
VTTPQKNPASAATGARAYNVNSQQFDYTQASEPVQLLLDRRWRHNRRGQAFPRRPHRPRRQGQAKARKQTSGERTAQLCLDRMIDHYGCPEKVWEYLDCEWQACGYTVQWDMPDAKYIGSMSRGLDDLWRIGDMPEPTPLYRLPFIRERGIDDPVYVTAGEKAADALVCLGLEATTSSSGAWAPERTDWTPLAGRQVTIWPDNDPQGLDYAYTVSGILTNLNPPATVNILDAVALGMAAKQDVAGFVQEGGMP